MQPARVVSSRDIKNTLGVNRFDWYDGLDGGPDTKREIPSDMAGKNVGILTDGSERPTYGCLFFNFVPMRRNATAAVKRLFFSKKFWVSFPN